MRTGSDFTHSHCRLDSEVKDIIMKSTMLHSSLAILALVASASAFANDGGKQSVAQAATPTSPLAKGQRASATHLAVNDSGGMRPVPNSAGPGQPGDGWNYYSDVAARRAVVISPGGDFYFNKGKGLKQITGAGSGN